MLVIFTQVFILFAFLTIGFALSKCGIVKQEHSKILSDILVYVFLPCNVFKTFAANFTVDYISQNYETLLMSILIFVILVISSHFISKLLTKHKYERGVYTYSIAVPNYGYMGYPLAESLIGTAGLMNFMMFGIPVSLYIYTFAFCMLTKRSLSFKRLLNPSMLATVLGIIAGLAGIPIPDVLAQILSKAAVCLAPVSAILTGIVISGFALKKIICNSRVYIVCFIRLIVIPLTLGFITKLFCPDEVVAIVVLFYALPCGLNTIVFPKQVEENCEIGAGLALVSNLIACITIPLIFTLFGVGI